MLNYFYCSLTQFSLHSLYAINISHANAIAEFYREHGIAAVAIDSKTPSSLRKELIERFTASSFSNHPSMVFTPPSVPPFPGDRNPLSKEGNLSNHPVPLSKEGSTFSPSPSSSGSGDVTALLGARNRYALRLADHQRSRHVVRDGTALIRCFLCLILRLILYESEESKDKLNMLLSSH